MAALDIRNFTRISMRLGFDVGEERAISDKWPVVVASGNEIRMALPRVSDDKQEIKRCLQSLAAAARGLSGGG